MTNLTQVYCIHCEKLVVLDKAYRVFKTGFYRNTSPLGQCYHCNDQAMIYNVELNGASALVNEASYP